MDNNETVFPFSWPVNRNIYKNMGNHPQIIIKSYGMLPIMNQIIKRVPVRKTMSSKQVAELLCITERSLANARYRGLLTPRWHRKGRRVIYFEDEVQQFFDNLPTFDSVANQEA